MSLTVKWIVRTDLGEVTRIFPANEVTVAYRDVSKECWSSEGWKVSGRTVEKAMLIIDGYSIDDHAFDVGQVYVMNSEGRTVGNYKLSDDLIMTSSENVPRAA